ncbi:MAG TPA: aspartate/glutamate racemase family protein [Candidatus Babeliales bacterium]|nr:aspartate/glutamate racemase family protein [Candidatus Babeliales bacterium]
MSKFKSIGIVGGAGPMASALLYGKIIQECQSRFGSVEDTDFPEMVILNFPFSSMINLDASEKNRNKIIVELQSCIDKLVALEVDIVAIACNTLHSFIADIDFKGLKLCNLIQITKEAAKQQRLKNLLFLGTATSRDNNLYNDDELNTTYVDVAQQKIVSEVIYVILKGKSSPSEVNQLIAIIKQNLQACDAVVLGCTEFSVLYDLYSSEFNGDIILLDPLTLLVDRLLQLAVNN